MADTTHTVHHEDVNPVRSRISWSAIAAGSVMALALYLLLTLLGSAIGLSISDRTSADTLGNSAAIWAILITAACLFTGGCLASQLSTGENKTEGAIYGLMVWAVVFAMLVWLAASTVRTGFGAMVGMASAGNAAAQNTTAGDWTAAAQRAGVPQAKIEEYRQAAQNAPAAARQAAEDPANRQAVADATTRVTWYTFLGTLVSMLAAAAGGYVGAGPTLHLFRVGTVRGGNLGHGRGAPALS